MACDWHPIRDADLRDLVAYALRARLARCTWIAPQCIGRAVGNACTCPSGMRAPDPADVVEAWRRGYKTVGRYRAAVQSGHGLLPLPAEGRTAS